MTNIFEKLIAIWNSDYLSDKIIKLLIIYIIAIVIINIWQRLRGGHKVESYRLAFIKAHPGVKKLGKKGYWYRCARCGKWCGRPGKDSVYIPENQRMEVDHIRPWSQGGTDAVWNLQAMCKPCNRNKSNGMTVRDGIKTVGNTLVHPIDSLIAAPVRKAGRQNKVLRGIGITKRK